MSRSPMITDDKLVMKVRKALKQLEPRKTPTEDCTNDYGYIGWKCPYCGAYCTRRNRYVYRHGGQFLIIDFAGYNMHFAHVHATPFWREQQLIKLISKEINK